MKDYYKMLGVSRDASTDEIKKAFHRLAHQHHPNKGGDEAKFKEINEAYQVLSNSDKRSQYDRFGTADGPGDFNWAWGKGAQNVEFDVEDLSDMFSDIFGGNRQGGRKNFNRGSDIQIDIEISLEETLNNIKKEVTLKKDILCDRCSGNGAEPGTKINECFSCRGAGEVQEIKKTFLGSFTRWGICPECAGEGQKPEKPCNVCSGDGLIKGEEHVIINIPAGVDSNQMMEIAGKGNAGKKNAQPGNLYIRVLVKLHRVFKRRGDDLVTSLPITYSQAVLGDKIDIPTLEEDTIREKVSSGTESGRVMKIKNRGIPHFSRFGRGDLYVQLNIEIPKSLTKDQKKLLNELKEKGL